MFRYLLVSLALLLALPATHAASPARSRGGAVTAMSALPQRFRVGIIRVTGDDARPNPASWLIVARSSTRSEPTTNFRVSRGQIISQRSAVALGTRARDFSPIAMHRVRIDSNDAWQRASRFFAGRGQRLASADMDLRQRGANSTPIWSMTCRQASGRRIGEISILASTGAVTEAR